MTYVWGKWKIFFSDLWKKLGSGFQTKLRGRQASVLHSIRGGKASLERRDAARSFSARRGHRWLRRSGPSSLSEKSARLGFGRGSPLVLAESRNRPIWRPRTKKKKKEPGQVDFNPGTKHEIMVERRYEFSHVRTGRFIGSTKTFFREKKSKKRRSTKKFPQIVDGRNRGYNIYVNVKYVCVFFEGVIRLAELE